MTFPLVAALVGGAIGAALGGFIPWPRQAAPKRPRLVSDCKHARRVPYTPATMFAVGDESTYASVCTECGQALRLKPTHH